MMTLLNPTCLRLLLIISFVLLFAGIQSAPLSEGAATNEPDNAIPNGNMGNPNEEEINIEANYNDSLNSMSLNVETDPQEGQAKSNPKIDIAIKEPLTLHHVKSASGEDTVDLKINNNIIKTNTTDNFSLTTTLPDTSVQVPENKEDVSSQSPPSVSLKKLTSNITLNIPNTLNNITTGKKVENAGGEVVPVIGENLTVNEKGSIGNVNSPVSEDQDNPKKEDIADSKGVISSKENAFAEGNQEKPANPEEKPVNPEEKPANPEEKPANPEEKPANPEEKPAHPEEKPAHPEEKPAHPEEKPAHPEEKPAHPEEKPAHPEEKPAHPEEKPAHPEENPAHPEENPAHPEENPSHPEENPSHPEENPSHPEENPSHPEENPAHPEENPAHPEENPAHPEENPAHPEENPAHPEENPAHPEENPAHPEENPAHPEENPAHPEEKQTKPGEKQTKPGEKPPQSEKKTALPDDKPVNSISIQKNPNGLDHPTNLNQPKDIKSTITPVKNISQPNLPPNNMDNFDNSLSSSIDLVSTSETPNSDPINDLYDQTNDEESETVEKKATEVSQDLDIVLKDSNKQALDSLPTESPINFPEQEDNHFFAYFVTAILVFAIGYLVVHNKQKILALIVEGRGGRRRRRSHVYKRLETDSTKFAQIF